MAYAKIIDIDDPGYFRLKSIDQSQLKQFLKNPADWAYHRLNDDHKPTDAMKFGTAFHAYLLGTSDVSACLRERASGAKTTRSGATNSWKPATSSSPTMTCNCSNA